MIKKKAASRTRLLPMFRGKPLFLTINLALLAVKREVEHELRAAIAPAQH